jgi:hypothetical protein
VSNFVSDIESEHWIPSLAYLNLGSYKYPISGFTNVDCFPWTGKEMIADLNKCPWPFADRSVQYIRAFDIFEHLGKLTKVEIMEEVARITKPGAVVAVRVPCVSHPWALSSIQHAHAFNYNSFEESYAQPWFTNRVVCVQFSYRGHKFGWNRFFKFLCKRTRFIFCITFELVRKGYKNA